MPIFILKRYHAVMPAHQRVWHLGREIAFEAAGEAQAVAMAQAQIEDLERYGGVMLLFDDQGKRLWQIELAALPLREVAE